MKKFFLTVILLCFISQLVFCVDSGKKSDPHLKIESRGLVIEEAYLSSFGQRFSSNQLQFQTKVNLNLSGVGGYAVKDDKVFIGCSMQVLDRKGNIMLDYADLFPDESGLDRIAARDLYLALTVGTPMSPGETYLWTVKVWDKIGKGEVSTKLEFKVSETEDKVGITVMPKGLKVGSIFMTNQEGALQSNQVNYLEKIKLNFFNLKGLSRKEGKVFIGGSMVISDSQGNVMLEYTDLFSDYDQTGVDPDATEKVHFSLVIGDPLRRGETYTWKARIWDKTGHGEIRAQAQLKVAN
ncbi:hypothetical protein QQ020_34195 [Fulvivirgaceae bacterium BMA12]|uniref:Uncharacterized protein n=1 Tax=Agaribacillus aureus TaxID=3051825 RepID=A0ABT8LH93_9BACT|nr:hypothetical protein [Fulvivirgaceae bacterium BMA12]